jgi:4-amino-4-deoxy-L-arabinose transferase-like glycosyltransferase
VALLVNAGILFLALPALDGFVAARYNVEFQDLYDLIANNLVHGNGYRVDADMSETMMREPGYPLFLAMVFKIAGYHIEAARFANLLLAFGSGLLLMRLTHRVTDDRKTALLATLLFLVYPGTLIAEARAGVEIGFIGVVILWMLFLYRAMEKEDLWRYFVAGMFMGAVALVRSVVLPLPLVLLVYLVLIAEQTRERLHAFVKIAALSLGLVLVISPWVIRNYMLTKELVPTASVAGMAAQEGLYTCRQPSLGREYAAMQLAAGRERVEFASQLGIPFVGRYYYQYFYDPRDEVNFSKALLKRTAAEYGKDPMLLASCGAKNIFFNFWFRGKTWRATWLNMALQVPLLALGLGGVVVLWKRRLLQKTGPMWIFILYIPAVHAPIVAHARYSVMIVPFLAIFASVAIVALWNAWRGQAPKGTGGSLHSWERRQKVADYS